MSSIFGVLNTRTDNTTEMTLQEMMQRLDHWVADGKGIWSEGHVGLGHLMLWNTPESLTEKLPFHDAVSQLCITADARVDNRDELLNKLNITPAQKNIPDSYLILKAYQKYRGDCVMHIKGDFAFAIWDEKEQQLFCARDQMGVKPFFYLINNNNFIFASEIKGILSIAKEHSCPDEEYLIKMMGGLQPGVTETYYKNIHRLQAAHTLTVKPDGIRLRKYWDLDATKETHFKTNDEYLEAFREKFSRAVARRTRSAYNIGLELSGGVDSSGITCMAASLVENPGKKFSTFSFVFPANVWSGRHSFEEQLFIDEVGRFSGITDQVKISGNDYQTFSEQLDEYLSITDGPEYLRSLWSVPLKKAAGQKNIRTILSGFPGDELVSNHGTPAYLDDLAAGNFMAYFKDASKQIGKTNALKDYIKTKYSPYLNLVNRGYMRQQHIHRRQLSPWNFLSAKYSDKLNDLVPDRFTPLKSYRETQKEYILRPNTSLRMEQEVLSGKKFRVEARFPMADIDLLEFVLSVPTHLKRTADGDRLLYKAAMMSRMPDEILEKPHIYGASVPFAVVEWIKWQPDKKEWLKKLIATNTIPEYLNMEKILYGYNFKIQNSVYKDLVLAKRMGAEMILKWFDF